MFRTVLRADASPRASAAALTGPGRLGAYPRIVLDPALAPIAHDAATRLRSLPVSHFLSLDLCQLCFF